MTRYYNLLIFAFFMTTAGLMINSYFNECDRYGLTLFRHRVFIEKISYHLIYEDGSKKRHLPSKKFAGERNISLKRKRYWWGVGCIRSEIKSYLKFYYESSSRNQKPPLASITAEFHYRINKLPEIFIEKYTYPQNNNLRENE
jgi:hypothetical protein